MIDNYKFCNIEKKREKKSLTNDQISKSALHTNLVVGINFFSGLLFVGNSSSEPLNSAVVVKSYFSHSFLSSESTYSNGKMHTNN